MKDFSNARFGRKVQGLLNPSPAAFAANPSNYYGMVRRRINTYRGSDVPSGVSLSILIIKIYSKIISIFFCLKKVRIQKLKKFYYGLIISIKGTFM